MNARVDGTMTMFEGYTHSRSRLSRRFMRPNSAFNSYAAFF